MDMFPIKNLFAKHESFKTQEETIQRFINLIWTLFNFFAHSKLKLQFS